MAKDKLQKLADKWLNSTLTKEEKKYLEDWYNNEVDGGLQWTLDNDKESLRKRLYNDIIEKIGREDKPGVPFIPPSKKTTYFWYAAAAVAIIILAVGYWSQYYRTVPVQQHQQFADGVIDVPPGVNTAILVLGNGTKIGLDSVENGNIAVQGDVLISKNAGQVFYVPQENLKDKPIAFNTIKTARGNQYNLTLSDGTRVWLNSVSSLKFPASFTGNERMVELTGEAYFEVARNEAKPFRVKVKGVEVEVLGTHFNINAYDDEGSIKTTLLEGAVKVWHGQNFAEIAPGEQAAAFSGTGRIEINEADIEKVIAWQSGFFEFRDTDLPAIMRQISRWYDVDIKFVGEPIQKRFGGRLSKDLNLGDVLKLFQANGVKFTLDGKELVVEPV